MLFQVIIDHEMSISDMSKGGNRITDSVIDLIRSLSGIVGIRIENHLTDHQEIARCIDLRVSSKRTITEKKKEKESWNDPKRVTGSLKE